MKRLLPILMGFALLLLSSTEGWSDNYSAGRHAYDKGDYADALVDIKPLAEQGHADAQTLLGIMYAKGRGVPQDHKTAVKWLTLAAKQGNAYAQRVLKQLLEIIFAENFQKSKDAFFKKDYATVFRLLKPLAELGYVRAQGNLGVMYKHGHGVAQNDKTAMKWYTLAAEQGNATAQFNLGNGYRTGQGVIQDYKTAVKWYSLSANQGNADARLFLGEMYENAQGVIQDYKTAVKWYTLAAEQGNAYAQKNLGFMYAKGKGVPQNDKTAVKWYTLAAEQRNAYAQKNLGALYAKGKGVPQNDKTAVKWYKLSAEQGDARAQFLLGMMYLLGRGVKRDIVYASMWTNLSILNGNEIGAKIRNIIAKRMTPADISTAQKLARECVRKKYKGC